jgi:hypothetical protein
MMLKARTNASGNGNLGISRVGESASHEGKHAAHAIASNYNIHIYYNFAAKECAFVTEMGVCENRVHEGDLEEGWSEVHVFVVGVLYHKTY